MTVTLCLTAGFGLAACGSSSPAATETTSGGAQYEVVSDADVASGLGAVTLLAARAQAESATSVETAKATVVEMFDKWYEFEGTIRVTDQPLYLELEDGLAKFKIGIQNSQPEKAVAGLEFFTAQSAKYLAAHPA